jgi:hypothetical protein
MFTEVFYKEFISIYFRREILDKSMKICMDTTYSIKSECWLGHSK